MLHSQAIQLANVLAAEVLKQIAAHQLLAKGDKDPLLDLLPADGEAVRAGAAIALRSTRGDRANTSRTRRRTQRTSSDQRRDTWDVVPG